MLYFEVNDKDPFGVTLVTTTAVGEESHDGCDDGNACILPGNEGGDGDDDDDNEGNESGDGDDDDDDDDNGDD